MEFYNSIHSYYDYIFPLNQKQVEWVNAECIQIPSRILDIGCATGNLAVELAKKGHILNAFDLDGGMIQLATQKSSSGNPQFRRANMLNIEKNYRADFFDVVVCFGNTLVHLTSESSVLQFFNAVYSVLKPGGKFLIQILNYDFILKNEIEELPIIENDRVRFVRQYYFGNDKLIQFKTRLLDKQNDKLIENTVELYALEKIQIEALLLKTHFKNIEFRSSFADNSFSPDKLPLIIKVEK